MYKACIFDLDGTLTDTLESLTYSVNATLQELQLPCITKEQCRDFVGNGARYLIEQAVKAANGILNNEQNIDHAYIDSAMKIYGRIFGQYCTYHVKPYEGIIEMLAKLKASGFQLAVLSNKPHAQTVDVVSMFFGNDTFSYVQGQMEGIPRKPNPMAAILLSEKMSSVPQECIYIGDSEVDMKTARAAGMTSVGVTWGFRSRKVLEENGAEHLADRPEQLVELFCRTN